MTDCMVNIGLGDCTQMVAACPGRVDLICTDPPYNIGIDYGKGKQADQMEYSEYCKWLVRWLDITTSLLTPTGSIYVIVSDEYAAEYAMAMKILGLHPRNWITWHETFGTNCQKKFSRRGRHILYMVKNPTEFTFNADDIRVPSARQLKYKDKRANPKGMIPGDVWEYPRVCGTHKERIKGVPTQLPMALVERIVRASSNPGDLVYDPFVGSGTVPVVALSLGRNAAGMELSPDYHAIAENRIERYLDTKGAPIAL